MKERLQKNREKKVYFNVERELLLYSDVAKENQPGGAGIEVPFSRN